MNESVIRVACDLMCRQQSTDQPLSYKKKGSASYSSSAVKHAGIRNVVLNRMQQSRQKPYLHFAGFLAFKTASIGWGHVSHSTMLAPLVCVIQVSSVSTE